MEQAAEPRREVILFLAPEVEALLADNETSIEELLRREGVPVATTFGSDPSNDEQSKTKEPVTVLLASAAVVAVLTPAVKRALTAFTHRPVVVSETVLVPVEDSHGDIVRDADGNPVLHWVERARVLEASPLPPETTSINLDGFGITVGFEETTGSP